MKFKSYKGFNTAGRGPEINDVTLQWTCGKEGYQHIAQHYGVRKKGYGKPKHSWASLFRVFSYLKGDKWMFFAAVIVTTVMIVINIVGGFVSGPLVDALLQPAFYSISGSWGQYSGPADYLSVGLEGTLPFYKTIFEMVDWTASPATVFSQTAQTMGMFLGILGGFYVLGLLCSIAQIFLMTRIGTNSLMRLRNDMFARMQRLPLSYFDQTAHGDIMSRFTNDVDNLAQFFNTGIMELFTSVTMMVGLLVFMFMVNWLLALVSLIMELIAMGIVAINVHRSVNAFSETQVSMGEFNGIAEEALSGLKVIKCFSKEDDIMALFKSIDYRHTVHNKRSVFLSSANVPIVNNMNNLTTALVAMIGVVLIATDSSLIHVTVGTLISYVAFLRMLARPFNNISNLLTMVQSSLAGAERIFQMIDLPPEPSLQKAKWRSYKGEDGKFYWTDGEHTKPLRGQVDMRHVDFSYVKGQPILHDITLYAHPGQKIALVGSTGAGKTTITNLLTRFYDIDAGEILIDGIDIKEIDRVSMRRSMTLVLQDTHLFSGTIMDNIRYGHLKASDERCIEAAKMACADPFIKKLSKGYDTYIDGANASLSQGQKQLLSIARCAVSNPPILILDEATSSVDTRTERLISKGMDNIMKGKTVFVIAHRLSTVRYADCIMVMDKGRIIERGTHDELLAQKGRYYELWMGKTELD